MSYTVVILKGAQSVQTILSTMRIEFPSLHQTAHKMYSLSSLTERFLL